MYKFKTGLIGLLILTAFIVKVDAADDYAWLHVDGKYIRKSLLCNDPNGIWMGCGVAQRKELGSTVDLQGMANWVSTHPANVVRLSCQNIEEWTSGQAWVQNYLAPVVEMYKQKKIYVIIDSHYYMHDSDDWTGSVQWDAYAATPSTWCARWLADWQYVANYFKDEPWVAGYELCNEPVFKDSWGNFSDEPQHRALARNNYKKCIELIRQVDKKHILFVGNHMWSHALYHKSCWEDDLPANEKYKPDPGYNQVVFTFHEYTRCSELYIISPGEGAIVNNELGRIQNTYNVPFMCTEFGQDMTCISTAPVWEKRRFEQELVEMCYGEPNFWQGVTAIPDPAYPSRGTPAVHRVGWMIWRISGASSTWETKTNWTDIWTYAAQIQVSPKPELITDPTPPSDISVVRDGTGTADISETNSTTQLSANWNSSTDAESGISRYWYAVGTTSGSTDIINWTSNGSASSVTCTGLNLSNGQKYYFLVKAQNGSLRYNNITASNGQTVIVSNGTNPVFYPNPFKTSAGIPAKFKLNTAGSGEVNIYTISGRPVKKLTALPGASTDIITWDGTNKAGEKTTNGIYLYTITQANGDKTSGKLILQNK
ncbi:MAG: hypothetical protein A2297_04415 [Elusimicrobia bacterium RIFOXYB2_FULL_48_7]|nr:MAG: hypothetical protein A2297_04415 [Elusimicrobia bacterium RIFOXYB2_FULL_48_7]